MGIGNVNNARELANFTQGLKLKGKFWNNKRFSKGPPESDPVSLHQLQAKLKIFADSTESKLKDLEDAQNEINNLRKRTWKEACVSNFAHLVCTAFTKAIGGYFLNRIPVSHKIAIEKRTNKLKNKEIINTLKGKGGYLTTRPLSLDKNPKKENLDDHLVAKLPGTLNTPAAKRYKENFPKVIGNLLSKPRANSYAILPGKNSEGDIVLQLFYYKSNGEVVVEEVLNSDVENGFISLKKLIGKKLPYDGLKEAILNSFDEDDPNLDIKNENNKIMNNFNEPLNFKEFNIALGDGDSKTFEQHILDKKTKDGNAFNMTRELKPYFNDDFNGKYAMIKIGEKSYLVKKNGEDFKATLLDMSEVEKGNVALSELIGKNEPLELILGTVLNITRIKDIGEESREKARIEKNKRENEELLKNEDDEYPVCTKAQMEELIKDKETLAAFMKNPTEYVNKKHHALKNTIFLYETIENGSRSFKITLTTIDDKVDQESQKDATFTVLRTFSPEEVNDGQVNLKDELNNFKPDPKNIKRSRTVGELHHYLQGDFMKKI